MIAGDASAPLIIFIDESGAVANIMNVESGALIIISRRRLLSRRDDSDAFYYRLHYASLMLRPFCDNAYYGAPISRR